MWWEGVEREEGAVGEGMPYVVELGVGGIFFFKQKTAYEI